MWRQNISKRILRKSFPTSLSLRRQNISKNAFYVKEGVDSFARSYFKEKLDPFAFGRIILFVKDEVLYVKD